MAGLHLASFVAEVTPPPGHALMGGGITPARRVADPLFVHGVCLLGDAMPVVLAAVDWCEIRNDAYAAWRTELANAAHTQPERVMLASVHQHDAPVADLRAEEILRQVEAPASVCDPVFHKKVVERAAAALRASLAKTARVTHVGVGQAKVEKVACNRRYHAPDGSVRFDRTSSTRDAAAQAGEEGLIDPWLKTVSFWNDQAPLAALSCYATHPMAFYGQGEVSADFPGLARKRRQADDPACAQIYFSGCSGNITAGKYNDGREENRPLLADRLYQAMKKAMAETKRHPVDRLKCPSIRYELAPREGRGFSREELEETVKTAARPFDRCLAAMGLSWRERVAANKPLDLPILEIGPASILVLPGESYVEYQLKAQALRPDRFVMAIGYGECATGYVPTVKAVKEGDTNLRDWCWVDERAEAALDQIMARALQPGK